MIHPGMTGAIVVGNGSSVGAGNATTGLAGVGNAAADDDASPAGAIDPLSIAAALGAVAFVAGALGVTGAIRRIRAAAPTG
jgi:hypothetical protein